MGKSTDAKEIKTYKNRKEMERIKPRVYCLSNFNVFDIIKTQLNSSLLRAQGRKLTR